MECTGRDQRDCSDCPGVCTDQCTDDSDCDCPPGPVVFLCKDPFFDDVNTFQPASSTRAGTSPAAVVAGFCQVNPHLLRRRTPDREPQGTDE